MVLMFSQLLVQLNTSILCSMIWSILIIWWNCNDIAPVTHFLTKNFYQIHCGFIPWCSRNVLEMNILNFELEVLWFHLQTSICCISSPILFLSSSKDTTRTVTLSPRFSFKFFIFDIWIRPLVPTPISTNAPKWVTFLIFPVTMAPVLKDLISWISFLKSGVADSEKKIHTRQF